MIEIAGGVRQTGTDVLGFQVWKILEDFCFGRAFGQHVQHVFDSDAHSADARPSAALLRIDSYSIHNASSLMAFMATIKPAHAVKLVAQRSVTPENRQDRTVEFRY